MALYNFETSGNVITLQPNLSYYTKIRIFVVLSVAAFIAIPFLPINNDVKTLCYVIAGAMAAYAIYDYIFIARVTMVFDGNTRTIYKKIPGLFTKELMKFEDVSLVEASEYGTFAYTIAHKEKRFLKNYPISDYFSNTKKGIKSQEAFETEVLTPLMQFIENPGIRMH